jgi:hypothetical protein
MSSPLPIALAITLGIVSVSSSRAQGFLDWRWSFDQGTFVVGPTDPIVLSATIFVRPESPAPLTGRAIISFQGSLFHFFDLERASDRIGEVNIPPGGSLRFPFGTLTPKLPLAPGTYRNAPDQPLIDFPHLGTRHVSESPLVIHVVPEPSTLALALFGLAAIALKFLVSPRKSFS